MERDQALKFMHDLLRLMLQKNGSDLFITTGFPPAIKIDGKIVPQSNQMLQPQHTAELARAIMSDRQAAEFEAHKECNFGISPTGIGRFRANAFVQQGKVGLVLRTIPQKIPNFQELGLPPVLTDIALAKRGLVIFVGGTGTGKTTSLTGISSGAWFGEGSLLKNEPRRYDVMALRETRVAFMNRATFHWLLDHSIPFNRFIIAQINERLGQFIGMIENERMLDTDARIARGLASVHQRAHPGPHVTNGQASHVGDAHAAKPHRAGLRSCWINRPEDHDGTPRAWPHDALRPDLEFATLTALADWLDAHPSFATEHAAA